MRVLFAIVGLKIKLRPGASKASKGSQPEDSGEDLGADSGEPVEVVPRKSQLVPGDHQALKLPSIIR